MSLRHACVLLATMSAGCLACAPPSAAPLPLFRFEAHAGRFVAPAAAAAGRQLVRLVNRDTAWHEALLVHFDQSDGGLDGYLARARSGDEYPSAATDLGGPTLVAPGDSTDVELVMPSGTLLIVDWHRDALLAGMATEVRVGPTVSETAMKPVDAEVTLSDFAISPVRLPRGRSRLQVRNAGPSEHELTILSLAAGAHLQDYVAWRRSGERGAAPARPVGGTSALPAGGAVVAHLSLAPGRYLLVCSIETVGATSVAHHALGMQVEVDVP